jgi:hypothetical protein
MREQRREIMEEFRRSKILRRMSVRNDVADENIQPIGIRREDSETRSEAHIGRMVEN